MNNSIYLNGGAWSLPSSCTQTINNAKKKNIPSPCLRKEYGVRGSHRATGNKGWGIPPPLGCYPHFWYVLSQLSWTTPANKFPVFLNKMSTAPVTSGASFITQPVVRVDIHIYGLSRYNKLITWPNFALSCSGFSSFRAQTINGLETSVFRTGIIFLFSGASDLPNNALSHIPFGVLT